MSNGKEQLTKGATLGAGVLLILAIVGFINYFGFKYYARFDWTREEIYSLSERTEGLLGSLDENVEAVVLMGPEAPLFDPVRELLRRYDAASPRLSVRHVDPVKNMLEAQAVVDEFQLGQLDVVVFVKGDERRIVETADLADYDYSGLQFGAAPEMTSFKGEQVFTSSILELVEDRRQRVFFTVGHGEVGLDEPSGRGLAEVQSLLDQDNFEIDEWMSLAGGPVPSNASLVVIAGPNRPFVESELVAIAEYLERGGRLLVMLDPLLAEAGGVVATGLEDVLQGYGVDVGNDVVVDPSNPVPFFGAETIFVDQFADHVVTRSLAQARVPVIVPLARSVSRSEKPPADLEILELMQTSSQGWGETSLGALDRVERDEADVQGPVSLAVAVSGEAASVREGAGLEDQENSEATDPRLMVFGDVDWITDSQLANVGNTELFLASVNWLVERENLIGIPAKRPDQLRLRLTESELGSIAWLVFGLLPGLAVLAGILVFTRRRR